ncbi:P-loop containing nucleoside triphosphate hydrolase protein [Biscogniauxia mediterranea]|nr:P-loop containing nucleoside triphosphate hydrolase protein [Biscogniauxia mediterranea]
MASGVGNNGPTNMEEEVVPISGVPRFQTADCDTIFEGLSDEGSSSEVTPTNSCYRTEGADESPCEPDCSPQYDIEDSVDSADDEKASFASGVEISEGSNPNYGINSDPNRYHGTSAHGEIDGIFSNTYHDYKELGPFDESTASSVTTTETDNDKVMDESLTNNINGAMDDESLFVFDTRNSSPSAEDDIVPQMHGSEHDDDELLPLATPESDALGYDETMLGVDAIYTDDMMAEDEEYGNNDSDPTQVDHTDSDIDIGDEEFVPSPRLEKPDADASKAQSLPKKHEERSNEKKQASRRKTGPRAKTAKEWFSKRHESRIESPIETQRNNRKKVTDKRLKKFRKRADQSVEAMLNSLQNNNPVEARIARGHIPEAEQITAKTKTSQFEQILNQVPENVSKRTVASDKKKLIEASRSFGYGNCVAQDGKWLIKGMKTSLHAHQVIASSWMLGREFSHDEPYGGILADEMGMGKTLETLGCIVSNRPPEDIGKYHKATLIIAPASAVRQWESEIKKHVDKTHINGILIFKQSQKLPEEAWSNMDIIIASYHEVSRQFPSKRAQAKLENQKFSNEEEREEKFNELRGPLFKTHFWRVVLDESHTIKNEQSQMSQACQNLSSEFRWSISGTPITNSVDELYPHLKFLVPSWDHDLMYFKHLFDDAKDKTAQLSAILSKIMIRRTTNDSFMGQPLYTIPLCHQEFRRIQLSEEERVIYDVLEARYREIMNDRLEKGDKKTGYCLELLMRLRQAIAHPFLLESTLKQTLRVQDLLEIQTRLAEVGGNDPAFKQIGNWCGEVNAEIENGHANGLSDSQIALNVGRFGYEWNLAKNISKVLDSNDASLCRICIQEPELPQQAEEYMLRERQSGKQLLLCPDCFTPLIGLKALVESGSEGFESNSPNLGVFGSHSYTMESSQDIAAFYAQFHNAITSNTNEPLGKDGKRVGRDFLGIRIQLKRSTSTFLLDCDKTYPKPIVPSAKTAAAMEAILQWQADAPDDKIIIFTDFKMTGAILGRMLQAQRVHFLYFYGDMTGKQKHNAIQAFHDREEVKVLIASLKCGGVALNLTCANRVILLDLWWNCAVELQAFARAFRMGQKKETHFLRIVAQNTIDNRIEALQGTKLLNINKVMESGSLKKEKNLTHDQVLSLFGKVQVHKDGTREVVADYTT